MAEELATEVVKSCILDSLKNVYSSISNYKDNLKQFKDEHQHLCAIKDDIVKKVDDGKIKLEEVTNEAKLWLENVEALLGDEQVKGLVNDDLRKAKDQCCFGLFLCNLYQRYDMSNLAKSKANEMKAKHSQPPKDPVTVPIKMKDLVSIPDEHLQGLKSREDIHKKILDLLKDDNVDAVGICGMGGAGKTTLAKEIENKGAKEIFDLVLMVEISQNANIVRIQDHIAGLIDLSSLTSNLSVDQRAKMLYNALKGVKSKGGDKSQPTKMLIILDNIWDKLDLNKVGIPHEKTTEFHSKLLYTNREKKICKRMGVEDKNIVDVEMLNDFESKYLFWETIGNKGDDDHEAKRALGDQLLKICGGLPLAITSLAKALKFQNYSEWEYYEVELKKPISCQSDEIDEYYKDVYKILETSYKFRNDNIKKFYLLASLYPHGSRIPVEGLLRYGIGLGLFQHEPANLKQDRRMANMWIEELISSSLLENDTDDADYSYKTQVKAHDYVKIHDVVRSCAILFSKNDGHQLMVEAIPQQQSDKSSQNYTAISLTNDEDYSLLKEMKLDKLETLLLRSGSTSTLDDDEYFKGMLSLKVLEVTGKRYGEIYLVPKSIKILSYLRALHLEGCSFGDGFEWIGELVGLVVLSLKESNVERLPHGMKKLINLRLLDLTECKYLRRIPANVIGSLTQLEGLYMLFSYISWKVNDEDEASTSEFRLLHQLKELEFCVDRPEQLTNDDIKVVFTRLHMFKLCVGYGNLELKANLRGDIEIGLLYLDYLSIYPYLHTFIARSYELFMNTNSRGDKSKKRIQNIASYFHKEGIDFPNLEMKIPKTAFSNLTYLELMMLENIEGYVLPADVAPNLTTLKVMHCEKLKFIWMENNQVTSAVAQINNPLIYKFPYLKVLQLKYLPNLQQVLGNQVESSTPSKSKTFFNPKIIFPSLEELYVIKCGKNFEKLWDIPDPMQQVNTSSSTNNNDVHFYQTFNNLKSIDITNVDKLKALGSPFVVAALVQLESLTISRCDSMKEVIIEETEISPNINLIFPKLNYLQLSQLNQLKCIYGGSNQLEFPVLSKLELESLPSLTRFVGEENSSTDHSNQYSRKQMELFPCLEKLEIRGNIKQDTIESMINGYKSATTTGATTTTTTAATAVLSSSSSSIASTSTCTKEIPFPCLRVLTLWNLDWKHVFSAHVVTGGVLDKLEIIFCDEMEAVFKVEENETNLVFPHLTIIKLNHCKKLKSFLSQGNNGQVVVNFPFLTQLKIRDCTNMNIFSYGPVKTPQLADVSITQDYGKNEKFYGRSLNEKEGIDINSILHTYYYSPRCLLSLSLHS